MHFLEYFNLLRNKILIKDTVLCLILSIFLTLGFNPIENILNNVSIFIEIISYLVLIFSSFWLFLILSFNQKILKLTAIILLFLSTINFYIYRKYGYFFDEIMIANALDSIGHVNDAIDYKLIIYFLFGLILPSIILIKIKINKTKFKNKIIIIIINLLIIISLLSVNKKIIYYNIKLLSPFNFINSIYLYQKRFYNAKKTSKNRISLSKYYQFSFDSKSKINLIIVLGESLRADHMEIFGYQRKNNPNLSKIKNLIKYQSRSFFTVTTPAINDLLSHHLNHQYQDIPQEKSLVELMQNLGFKTNWFSVQSSKQFGSEMINVIAMEANKYFFRDQIRNDIISKKNSEKIYDHYLLSHLDNSLKNSQNNFVVLHTFGSHMHYFERYPDEFIKYQPLCLKDFSKCNQEQIFNAYDNTVFYTDYFLDQVIKIADQSNSILFFISDHGSFLGENGIYANGKKVDKNNNEHVVPMFIYFSNMLLKDNFYKQKFLKAQKNSKVEVNPDYFFDSVLGCLGVRSELIDNRKYNLCNDL